MALLQNHKPMAFASKALTKAECCYANIEREMLAVIFGAERFRTYIRSQASGIHLLAEPGRHTSLAVAHATAPPGL